MTVIAAVDVGGSGLRAVIRSNGRDRGGSVERAVHLGSSIGAETLAAAIVDLVAGLGEPQPQILCIGMTGFPGLIDDPARLAGQVMSATPATAVIVAGDSLTTHVGALAMEAGVVVAAGTGVIALGTDHRSRWTRVDGWGHLLGDEGSGAWIGRAGLAAAMRAHDGRGGSQALLAAVRLRYGAVPDVLHAIYDRGSPAYELARFAPAVADAAEAGDAVAAEIWREAARLLADTAVIAAAGLEPVFSWGGGLFRRDALLLQPFIANVRERLPAARFSKPLGGSLEGALRLADRFETGDRLALGEYVSVHVR